VFVLFGLICVFRIVEEEWGLVVVKDFFADIVSEMVEVVNLEIADSMVFFVNSHQLIKFE